MSFCKFLLNFWTILSKRENVLCLQGSQHQNVFSALYRFSGLVRIDYSTRRNIWHPLWKAHNKSCICICICGFGNLFVCIFGYIIRRREIYGIHSGKPTIKTGFICWLDFCLVVILFNGEKQENKNYLNYHNKRERMNDVDDKKILHLASIPLPGIKEFSALHDFVKIQGHCCFSMSFTFVCYFSLCCML